MKIYVKFYATLRQYIPHSAALTSEEGLDVADGTTITQVMEMLRVPEALNVLALVNGLQCRDRERVLKEGDSLVFYPPMTGG